jgi:hypothetical protein
MKVTKTQLKQIIKEEVEGMLRERGIQAYTPGHPTSRHDEEYYEDEEVELYGDQEGLAEEEEKWAQKAAASIEKKGTEGEFTKYCKGDVTQGCIDRAAKGSSTKRKRQAAFAANVNSHDDLKYPKDTEKKD